MKKIVGWMLKPRGARHLFGLIIVGAGASLAAPASAAVQVYTDQALFDRDRAVTNYTFSFPGTSPILEGQSYTLGGVKFSVPTAEALYGLPPDATLTDPHLAALPNNATAPTISMSFGGPVLGLTLASYYEAQTISYNVNGTTGTLTLPANEGTRFIGFDTGAQIPINATFTFLPNANGHPSSIDVVSFQTALPEPATWGMMILGFAAIGLTMRRRKAVTRVACAV